MAGLAGAPLIAATTPARAQDGHTRDTLTRRLRDGRIELATLSGGRAQAVAMIDATFTRTIRALCDFARYEEWLAPVVHRSVVLSRSHGHALLYVEIAIAGGAETRWAELDVRIVGVPDGSHTLTARKVRGDVRSLAAELALVATPGRVRTLVGATMRVDLDLPLPLDANRDAARSLIQALRLALR